MSEVFYGLAESAMYDLFAPIVINARDYGVPQNRRRVFILGHDRKRVKEPVAWPPQPTYVAPNSKSSLPRWLPASVVFDRPPLRNGPNDIHMKHGRELSETFARTPPNGGSRKDSGRVLPCHENHIGHHDVYGRIDPSLPAPTMTTACINPSRGRFVHPTGTPWNNVAASGGPSILSGLVQFRGRPDGWWGSDRKCRASRPG